jgi:hypothetical protein
MATANPPRSEIEAALETYFELGARAAGHAHADWNKWADQFTEDALYVEPQYGVFRGREQIRAWIVPLMEGFRAMLNPIEWHMIDGDRVGFYLWNVMPHPDPARPPFRFQSFTLLQYRDGLWCFEEDFYDVTVSERMKDEIKAYRAGK